MNGAEVPELSLVINPRGYGNKEGGAMMELAWLIVKEEVQEANRLLGEEVSEADKEEASVS